MAKIIAAIGAGGKTTALGLLARQGAEKSVLLTTTTHIYPFAEARTTLRCPLAQEIAAALRAPGIVCAGNPAGEGKLGTLPQDVLAAALERADLVLYEGDGSRRLPLKLHRADEPMILPNTHRCLVVAGLSALGRPVGEVVHRYGLNPFWREEPQRIVGGEEFAFCVLETVKASGLPLEQIKVFLNQVDMVDSPEAVEVIIKTLKSKGLDTRAGNLVESPSHLLRWLLD